VYANVEVLSSKNQGGVSRFFIMLVPQGKWYFQSQ